LGMWKAGLEGVSGPEHLWWRLHGVSAELFAADLYGPWRRAQTRPVDERAANVSAQSRAEFEALASHVRPAGEAPGTAVVWGGPEGEMHREPWRFGHASGARNGRHSCSRWAAESALGLGCGSGMACFWRDTAHQSLARRTVVTPQPAWERGRCGSSEEEALCYLIPGAAAVAAAAAAATKAAVTAKTATTTTTMAAVKATLAGEVAALSNGAWPQHVLGAPFPSPFSAASAEDLENHIQMVLWEGRRSHLAAHVFPPSDVPSHRIRRGFAAREAAAARVSRLRTTTVKPQGSLRAELLKAAAEVSCACVVLALCLRLARPSHRDAPTVTPPLIRPRRFPTLPSTLLSSARAPRLDWRGTT